MQDFCLEGGKNTATVKNKVAPPGGKVSASYLHGTPKRFTMTSHSPIRSHARAAMQQFRVQHLAQGHVNT